MAKRRWTDAEKKYLEENHKRYPIAQLAKDLGRNIASVGSYLRGHGLARYYAKRRWTTGEVFKLYLHAERYGPSIIAKKLNRTVEEIRRKTQRLRIGTRTEVYSEREAKKETGYHEYQLHRARAALGQEWKVELFSGPGRRPKKRYTITQRQLNDLCDYLKTDPLKHSLKKHRAA